MLSFFKRDKNRHGSKVAVGAKRGTLTVKQRLNLYNQLALYLRNNHKLDVALSEMYKIHSEDGKRRRNKVALMLQDIAQNMAAGYSFSDSLAPYIPEGEFFLISAGEKSSFLERSMQQSIRLIQSQERIAESVKKALVYNVFLGLMLVGVLVVAAYYLIPQSMVMISPEQLTGFARIVYLMSEFVVNQGIYVLIFIILLILLVKWAQPNYIGKRRILLDNFWPFSLYRAVNGATFLISLSSLMQANVSASDALEELASNANPYLRQRIMAARSGLHHGEGLGESLHISGYNFPDKEAIRHLRILGSKSGVEVAIERFADDWLEETIKKTDATADIVKTVGMVMVFGVAGIVILGVAMIQYASQSAMGVM